MNTVQYVLVGDHGQLTALAAASPPDSLHQVGTHVYLVNVTRVYSSEGRGEVCKWGEG